MLQKSSYIILQEIYLSDFKKNLYEYIQFIF